MHIFHIITVIFILYFHIFPYHFGSINHIFPTKKSLFFHIIPLFYAMKTTNAAKIAIGKRNR